METKRLFSKRPKKKTHAGLAGYGSRNEKGWHAANSRRALFFFRILVAECTVSHTAKKSCKNVIFIFCIENTAFAGFQTSKFMKKGQIHQNCVKLNPLSNEPKNVNFGKKLTFLIQKNRFSNFFSKN